MCPPLSPYKALSRPSSKIKSWYRPALASYDASEQIPEPASLSAKGFGTPLRWAWRGHGPARAHTGSGHPCFRLWGGAVRRLTGVGGASRGAGSGARGSEAVRGLPRSPSNSAGPECGRREPRDVRSAGRHSRPRAELPRGRRSGPQPRPRADPPVRPQPGPDVPGTIPGAEPGGVVGMRGPRCAARMPGAPGRRKLGTGTRPGARSGGRRAPQEAAAHARPAPTQHGPEGASPPPPPGRDCCAPAA